MKKLIFCLLLFLALPSFSYCGQSSISTILKGDKGDTGNQGTAGNNGADGANGINGTNGTVGIGIASAIVNGTGWLNLTLSNNTVLGPWNVTGPQGGQGSAGSNGNDGISISNAAVNATGWLNITLDNATVLGPWNVTGPQGQAGAGSTITKGTALVKDSYAVSTTTIQAHGLAARPDFLDVYWTAKNATVGYAAGAIIKFNGVQDTGVSMGFVITADAVNTTLITGAALPEILNATARTEIAITAVNWNLTVVPYKFTP